jgi:predicted RecB family nuclease
MKSNSGHIRLSASDLSNHLACHHLTSLDLAVAIGERAAPKWKSPDAEVLQQRGMEHEEAYLKHLEAAGLAITDLREIDSDERAFAETCAAMDKGVAVIAQATLANGRWFGKSDVLRRVERPSRLGDWSYEVYDCKLARETKATTILQLSLYSELLSNIQGVLPEWMYVVPPVQAFQTEPYRITDFAAYYRYVKARLGRAVESEAGGTSTYPDPNPHCSVCRWWLECDAQWRRDDHLSLVAGISKLQRKQLQIWEAVTVEQLASFPLPIQHHPEHGSKDGYVRVREQARVQVAGRHQGRPVHELLEILDERGLSRLPEPSSGDMFFDLEGDPFVGSGGREYLFGVVTEGEGGNAIYDSRWGTTPQEEKQAFEWFVDLVMSRWARYPAMHIYHFAPYEPSALKRLMGRYATREDEIDRMLRAGLLIDLHTVLKQAVRASVEEYSLKALEVFHGFGRTVPLDEARRAMRQVEHGLELGRPTEVDEAVWKTIQGYNADDCVSTRSLRNWFESERRVLEQAGHKMPRPPVSEGAPPEAVDERQLRVAALVAELQAGVPAEIDERTDEQRGRWLLADLLDWHRRESKADWWEYYRLRDLPDEDLVNERSGLGGLQFVERIGLEKKIPVDRYSFEKQDTDVRRGDKVCTRDNNFGQIVAIDLASRTVDIKKTKKAADSHPAAVFVDSRGPSSDTLAEALFRLGMWVKTNAVDAPGAYQAGRDLLLRQPPRLTTAAGALVRDGESTVDAAKRIAVSLDHSVLAIQGPPGAGKTYTGARMICELIRQKKKVGITAVSHKVIRNLLDEVLAAANHAGMTGVTCVQKVSETSEEDPPGITMTTDNAVALAALHNDGAAVVAGTAWLWSREDVAETLDVLFVDEAGQMSLANVLAVAQSAKSIVLLGDPQQLEQPLRGSHPEGAEASALEHLLAGEKTIPPDKGLFLEKTWRMHPKICRFTSEVFYEGRLASRDGLERQRIEGHPWLGDAGLWFIPVNHAGNQNASPEEVERVAGIVEGLLQPDVRWVDDKGGSRSLRLEDILIVAPYNAQVSDLSNCLKNARVGTVDKFQGQEAPVVIYSLTTSSPEDAPRGMEFLYSLNRLNVATSRARALVIVVGSPRLLEPECRSPRQMQLANALCRFAELAQTLEQATQAA